MATSSLAVSCAKLPVPVTNMRIAENKIDILVCISCSFLNGDGFGVFIKPGYVC